MLEFDREGKRLLAAQLYSAELPVWNLEDGQVKRLQLKHREGLLSATISDDGEWIVTTSFDAFASLWEVDSGRELARFTGQFIGFRSATISPDKTRVALTSNDSAELSLWDPANEQQLVSLPDQGPPYSSVFPWDPSSDNIATLVGSKLRLWRAPSWAEIEAAQNGRPVQAVAHSRPAALPKPAKGPKAVPPGLARRTATPKAGSHGGGLAIGHGRALGAPRNTAAGRGDLPALVGQQAWRRRVDGRHRHALLAP